MATRRRNPQKDLMPLLVVGGGIVAGFASYAKGESDIAAGNDTTGMAAFAKAIGGLFKGAGSSVNQPSGGTTAAPSAHVGVDPGTLSNPGAITAAAKKAGVTSATDPRAYAYGKALWATQHGGDPSGYSGASGDDQVTWNSVAIGVGK